MEEWIAASGMMILKDGPSNRDMNKFKEVQGDCQEHEGGNSWNQDESLDKQEGETWRCR